MEFKLVKIHTKLRLSTVLYRFLFTLCIASTSYATDPIDRRTADEARNLIDQGLKSTIGFEVVKSLTTEVGPRLAGTEAEARARDWGVAKFKELGFSNIRIEPFSVDHWERRHEHVIQSEETTVTFPFPLTVDGTDVHINGVKLWYGNGSGDGTNSDFAINVNTKVVSFGVNRSLANSTWLG